MIELVFMVGSTLMEPFLRTREDRLTEALLLFFISRLCITGIFLVPVLFNLKMVLRHCITQTIMGVPTCLNLIVNYLG